MQAAEGAERLAVAGDAAADVALEVVVRGASEGPRISAEISASTAEPEEEDEAGDIVAPLFSPSVEKPAGPRRRYSVALQPGELEQFVQVVEEPQGDCGLETLTVVCPEGVSAGDMLYVSTPDGDEVEVAVPEGVGPGDEFEVQLGGAAAGGTRGSADRRVKRGFDHLGIFLPLSIRF